mgnify:CR=1 FL=1
MKNYSVQYSSLAKKNVVITGGATGIGSVIAKHFYKQGSQVIILDIKQDDAILLLKSMPSGEKFLQPEFFYCDLTNTEEISQVFIEIHNKYGYLDVLCNNAADDQRHDWESLSSQDWDYYHNINSKSQYFCIKEFVKFTNSNKGGSIICIGSISYLNGTTEMPVYTIAKAGLVGMVNTMAKILGERNIRVNLIQPGWIMTEKQLKKWVDAKAESLIMNNQLLIGKLSPDEPAKLVLFLASDQACKITKQIINVDAGWV